LQRQRRELGAAAGKRPDPDAHGNAAADCDTASHADRHPHRQTNADADANREANPVAKPDRLAEPKPHAGAQQSAGLNLVSGRR
jgi:hypothetical protein